MSGESKRHTLVVRTVYKKITTSELVEILTSLHEFGCIEPGGVAEISRGETATMVSSGPDGISSAQTTYTLIKD